MKFRNQIRANAQIYMKTLKEKITKQERGFHYNPKKIIMVVT